MVLFLILAIVGIALIVAGIIIKKKFRIAFFIVGGLMAAVGCFMVICTIYFAWAVRNDAPDPGYPLDGDGYDNTYGNTSTGMDWRTYRSYTDDIVINDEYMVCMSRFDDGSGYAVYDSFSGDRIGSLTGLELNWNDEFACEDIDGDGVNELGVVLADGTVWYRLTDSEWIEGVGGGHFERIE